MSNATTTPPAACALAAFLVALYGCPAGPEVGLNPLPPGTPEETGDAEDPGPPADPAPFEGEACDGFDDDGDGRVDEGCACAPGEEQPCYAGDPDEAGVGACRVGRQRCASDFEFGRWDTCEGQGWPEAEICDGVDNDCDGDTDEGCECRPGDERACYGGPAGTEGRGICAAGTERCVETEDGSAWSGDCVGEAWPEDELCDGALDEDCDGLIDEGCECVLGDERECYPGPPGTRGVGVCGAGSQRCEGAAGASSWGACAGAVVPSAEVCSSGRDEDCDGLTDCDDPDCDALCCEPWGQTLPVVPADGEIMFVVDRSGSMDWPAASGATRWIELRRAMDTVLPMVDDMELGLLTFPFMTGGASELLNCEVGAGPDVTMGIGRAGAISARLTLADPRAGDTPTPEALATVEAYLSTRRSSRERFVVLATDGLPEPNCGSTVPATVAAIERLRAAGVDTFVLGIVGPGPSGDASGIPALRDGLNRMADAGGRARPGLTRYYEAVDGASLPRTLEAILAAATDCTFELATEPPRPAEVVVRHDGDIVPAAGYDLAGRTLRFRGVYCDAIQAGLVRTVDVRDDC